MAPAGGIRALLGTCSSCIKYWFLCIFRLKNAKRVSKSQQRKKKKVQKRLAREESKDKRRVNLSPGEV